MLGRSLEQQPVQASTYQQQRERDSLLYYQHTTKRFKSVDGSCSPREPISVLDVRSPSPSSSSLSSLHSSGEGNIVSSLFDERKILVDTKGGNTYELANLGVGTQAISGQQHGGMVMGCDSPEFRKRGFGGSVFAAGVDSCSPAHLEMSNCFEVLARSADVNTKGVGQSFALPFHNVKLEWPLGMSNNSGNNTGYDSSLFQGAYMGDGMTERRGLNQQPLQQIHAKQGSQGNAFMSSSGGMKEIQGTSTESNSVVINAGSNSDGGVGSGAESTRLTQMRGGMEEQWWVDCLAPTSMAPPPPLSQQENSLVGANPEFGVPRQQQQHIEDFESMLLMTNAQPPDQTIMKWLMGDGQAHGQVEIQQQQPAQRLRVDVDAVMFDQDSWSSNQQHQSSHQLGGGHGEIVFSGQQISQEHNAAGDTYSSSLNNVSISVSPSSPKTTSDPNFLHTSYSSLPRALSLPSHLQDISLNSPKRTGVPVPTSTTTPIGMGSIDGPSGHPFSAPSSFLGAISASPNTSVAGGDYYAQTLLAGNPMSGGQLLQGNNYTMHQTGSMMEDGPRSMQVGPSSSPSSMHAFRANLPSLAAPTNYYQHDTSKDFAQRSVLHRSFSSLPSTDSQSQQQMKVPGMGNRDYLLQRQRSWNAGRPPPQRQLSAENRSPKSGGEWKNRTGGALSPLSSVPGFSLRSSPQHGGGFQVAADRKQDDVKPDTGQQQQMEGGVISEDGMTIVNLLLRAAEAVDVGNSEMAKAILARLNQHISPTREKSIHRVAHYFREALVTRLMGAENFKAQLAQDRTLPPLEEFHKINAYVRFCEVSPYPKFAHFTANQAILEALEGEEAMHVVDFQMGAGAQWASFIQDIASLRALGKAIPTLRLTAIGTRSDEIHATGANLCNFARVMNISLEFQAVVTRPECLDVSMLGLRDKEAVAVNFVFSLHELLDGETSSGLVTVLKVVLEAHPKVVTTVEQEANHGGPFFQQRFSEALQYYTFLFDSLTSSLDPGADSSVNSSIEGYLLAPEILNIVACDGTACVERHERLEQWRERMLTAGFHPRPLSDASQFQAEKLVAQISARRGFQVSRDKGSLLLGWQGRPLLAASSWIC